MDAPSEEMRFSRNVGSSELAFAAPGFVPSPRYFAKLKLLQRSQSSRARVGQAGAGRITNHGIFERAEAANASLVRGARVSDDTVIVQRNRRRAIQSRRERIATLRSRTQDAIDEAAGSRSRGAS